MTEVSAASEKRRVALFSLAAAVVVLSLKIVIGLVTGSLAILSEAAHSGLDLMASSVTYFSVRISAKPADADHTYGHQKFENFSAIVEMALMLVACFWIVYEAFHRLFNPPHNVDASFAAFGVMALSVAADFLRSRALRQAAAAHNSPALEADALNFSTDMWSSSVVILGLLAIRIGDLTGLHRLQTADPLAALAVAAIILVVTARLGKRAAGALLDTVPSALPGRIAEQLASVPGVLAIDRVRARHGGGQYFVDANIAVERDAPFEHVKSIVDASRAAVHRLLPGADVMIHSEPRGPHFESVFDTVRRLAARRRLAVHELAAYSTANGLALEFHLEVDDKLTLEQAHRSVSELEAEIHKEAPQVADINIHIENEGEQISRSQTSLADLETWRRPLVDIARSFPDVLDCHHIVILGAPAHPSISCHCVFPGDMPIGRVHDITSQIENRFRRAFPQVYRVTIHPEPHTELRSSTGTS